MTFNVERVIGHGSFGVVFEAVLSETGERFAIKKVLQDKRYKSRELQILKLVSHHRNIAALRHCFHSVGSKDRADDVFCNLVLEFLPDTLGRFARSFSRSREYLPVLLVKVFMFQLARALAFLHLPRINVCHRDIKPQNLLIDPATGVLKLCDFGSAKQLVPGEKSAAYICSRFYRAPELLFGATTYTHAVDTWAMGCVLGELLLGAPLFAGESAVDQVVELCKVLGAPTTAEIAALNPAHSSFSFPSVPPVGLARLFRRHVPADAVDLLSKLLRYAPADRITPGAAMAHPFFDELRQADARLPSGRALPELFDLSAEEVAGLPPGAFTRIAPPHRGVAAVTGGGAPTR